MTLAEKHGLSAPQENWQSWFDRHAPALVLYARQWTATHADAEDIAQEAFVRFWRSGRQRAESPLAYLYACVRHTALDYQRSAVRRRQRETQAANDRADCDRMFAPSLEDEQRQQNLNAALAGIPPAQREVVVLKIWGELTFAQIAEVLEIPANTAASRYRYALENLRRQLSSEATI